MDQDTHDIRELNRKFHVGPSALSGRFPFVQSVRSDQTVLKWNARVLRTGSGQNGPAHGSEPLSSPAPVGQSAGIWGVVAGKLYVRALDLSI